MGRIRHISGDKRARSRLHRREERHHMDSWSNVARDEHLEGSAQGGTGFGEY